MVGKTLKDDKEDIVDKFCEFTLSECQTIIYNYKVVLVSEIREIKRIDYRSQYYFAKECTHKAYGINDDYPKFEREFFKIHEIKRAWEFLIEKIPYLNPPLIKFFIDNNFIHKHDYNHFMKVRPGEIIHTIIKTRELIKNIDSFSIDKAISSYEVKIIENAQSRPGKDDYAFIIMKGVRTYWSFTDSIADPYMDEILPEFYITIAENHAFTPAEKLLNDLWERIGGEKKREELNKECNLIREKNIMAFRKRYSQKKHFVTLRKYLFEQERKLRLNMEIALRKTVFY